jgi:hypothetical protein
MKRNTEAHTNEQDNTVFDDPGKVLMIIYLAAIVFFLLLGSLTRASAQTSVEEQGIDTEDRRITDEVKSGELPIASDATGTVIPAPLLTQDMDIAVSGMIVKTSVNQCFKKHIQGLRCGREEKSAQ